MEIPLFQPLVERADDDHRFIVNDIDRIIVIAKDTSHSLSKSLDYKPSSAIASKTNDLESKDDTNPTRTKKKNRNTYDIDSVQREQLKGSASIALHSIPDQISSSTENCEKNENMDTSIFVSTCALPTNPNILSVSIIPAQNNPVTQKNIEPSKAELDISDLKNFGPFPIKTETFIEMESASSYSSVMEKSNKEKEQVQYKCETMASSNITIRFNFIDSSARVLVLRLAYSKKGGLFVCSSTEQPEVELHEFPIHTLLPGPAISNTSVSSSQSSFTSKKSTHELQTISYNTIEWLNRDIVVFCCKPIMILCADLKTNQVIKWNVESCIQTSKLSKRQNSRRSTLSNMLSLIVTSTEESNGNDDGIVAPISALSSISQTSEKGKEKCCVFSLHTDGSVRLWRVKLNSSRFRNSLYPDSVRQIRVKRKSFTAAMFDAQYSQESVDVDDIVDEDESGTCNPPLPESTLWGLGTDAISMTSRLYDSKASTFALAISIQTLSPSFQNDSPVSLLVLHGNVESNYDETVPDQFLILNVPPNVENTTQLSFSPDKRCSLHSIFSCKQGSKGIIAKYPPSCMVLLGRVPEIIDHTINNWANTEIQALSNLSSKNFTSHIQKEELDDDVLRNVMRDMDSYFMRRLFSPSFIGICGNQPLSSCIRNAFHKVVPGYSTSISNGKGTFVSTETIEIDTILVMQEWAKLDETKRILMLHNSQTNPTASDQLSPSNSTTSVYQVFSSLGKRTEGEMNNLDEVQNNSIRKLDLYHGRWTKLLTAIWKEHCKLLEPLSILSIAQNMSATSQCAPSAIILCSGVTSILIDSTNNTRHSIKGLDADEATIALDTTAQSLGDLLMNSEKYSKDVVMLEDKVNEFVSTASLISANPNFDFIDELKRLGSIVMKDVSNVPQVFDKYLRDFGQEAFINWASIIPDKLPKSLTLSLDKKVKSVLSSTNSSNISPPPSMGVKLGTAFVIRGFLRSARALSLSRCILLCGLLTKFENLESYNHIAFKSIQLYLEIVAVDWVTNQRMKDIAKQEKKIEKYKNISSSVFPNRPLRQKTHTTNETILDAYISLSSSYLSTSTLNSTIDAMFHTCSAFSIDALHCISSYKAQPLLIPALIESGLIKRWHQPKLALRLLAPSIGIFSLIEENSYGFAHSAVSAKIKMLAAECLLVEANYLIQSAIFNDEQCHVLRKRASMLYWEANMDYDRCFEIANYDIDVDVDTAFYVLTKGIADWHSCVNAPCAVDDESTDQSIISELNLIIFGKAEMPADHSLLSPIFRLSQFSTCRALILSWLKIKDEAKKKGSDPYLPFMANEEPETHIRVFFHLLRKVSHLLDRLALIERYTTDHKLLLECANDAITALNTELPKDMVYDMTESATLWSATFHHAMEISDWNKALSACRMNPLLARRKASFRRLVIGMVDSGALGDLLKLAAVPVGENYVEGGQVDIVEGEFDKESFTSSVNQVEDFYEAAVSILAEQAMEETKRNQRVLVSDANACDYRGCLYALHVSHGDWKRAAEVMNKRVEASLSTTSKSQVIQPILKDLSFSALACVNSIQMVAKKNHRFLIEGSNLKKCIMDSGNKTRDDKISVLKNNSYLEEQSLRLSAQHKLSLCIENAGPLRMLSTLEIIWELSKSGCFTQALILAKKRCSRIPGGKKHFDQILSHILCEYLIPIAVAMSRKTPSNTEECDNDWESDIKFASSPNMAQLHNAMTTESNQMRPSFVSENWRLPIGNVSVKSKASMELIRRLTVAYSNSSNSLALDVAGKFLDLDMDRALLPIWLVNVLLGRTSKLSKNAQKYRSSGLFANPSHKTGNAADPSSLLRLYMKRGMYVLACNVVTEVILGHDGGTERKHSAIKRIPEKGSIDFIPYASIDLLAQFIQIALDENKGYFLDSYEKETLLKAREKMEQALQFHFEMIKISEMGLRSARVLIK